MGLKRRQVEFNLNDVWHGMVMACELFYPVKFVDGALS